MTPSVSGTEDFEIRWYTPRENLDEFPDDHDHVADYGEQVNRVTLLGSTEKYGTLFVQVDQVSLFGDRYYLDDVEKCESQLLRNAAAGTCTTRFVNLEKVTWSRDFAGGNLSLGDSYVALGRGIVTDLDRNVDLDIDTSVRGFDLMLRPGAWDVAVFAGVLNPQQVLQDNPNALPVGDALPQGSRRPSGPGIGQDRMHGVAGFRLDRYGLGKVNAAAQAVVWDFVEDYGIVGLTDHRDEDGAPIYGLGHPDFFVTGGSIEAIDVKGADLFVEGNAFVDLPGPRDPPDAAVNVGHAIYGTATLYPGRTVWLFEGKAYRDAAAINTVTAGSERYPVVAPPSVEYERVITEDSSSEIASNDTFGGRLRVDFLPSGPATPDVTRATPYVSVSALRDRDLYLHLNTVPETIVHPVVGVEVLAGHSAFLGNLGARVDVRDDVEVHGTDRQLHADFDFKHPIKGEWFMSVSAAGELFGWGNNGALQQHDYVESESSITLQRGSELAFVWYTDVSQNPIIKSTGNLTESLYGAAEIQVKPGDAWTVKAFYGAYKAGIRCSGGQCRQLPGFEGARFSVTGSF